MTTITNISGYKFTNLDNLLDLQRSLKQHCKAIDLKGTILLSTEGININLAGLQEQINRFRNYLAKYANFADIVFKETYSDFLPFQKMWVKIKKEIIRFNRMNVLDNCENAEHTISPTKLKEWLDEGKPVTLLDTRNDYETMIGTFKSATTLDIKHFTDLPERITELSDKTKQQPIVMFCTGGIRCEKVLPLFLEQGFDNVYQLEGGILNYFAKCGGEHYQGECFVFDDRVALDSQLQTTPTILCKQCQMPVTALEQQSELYKPNRSCPHCANLNV